ncbi:MAG: family 10 glycosylhydrolase [Firmicutes bacterium]|nr:family 10 glycosylhydrolase [Bacillota bacterium]
MTGVLRRVSIVLMAAFLLVALGPRMTVPAAAGHQEYGVRGVWLWGSTVRELGAESIAKDLEANHVNVVFLLVRGTAGTAGYKSSLAPLADPNRDALAEMIAACHPRGIEVHAWFVFNQDKAYTDAHPEARVWHRGRPAEGDTPFEIADGKVCPDSQAHLEYTCAMIREVLENYDVDGIHLDYIRYGHAVYCFCPHHYEKAANLGIDIERVREAIAKTFYDGPYGPKDPEYVFRAYEREDYPEHRDVKAWMDMRADEVRAAIESMRSVVKQLKPNAAFSASLMPEGALADSRTYALCHYAQRYCDAEPYDFICPMAYHADYGKTPAWVGTVTQGAIAESNGKPRVYAGIQAYGKVTPQDLADAVKAARLSGADGFVLFKYGDISSEEWRAVNQALGEIGPWVSLDERITVGPNPASERVTFWYDIPEAGTLCIYDIAGRLVYSAKLASGKGSIEWNLTTSSGARLAPGVYVFTVVIPGEAPSRPQRLAIRP